MSNWKAYLKILAGFVALELVSYMTYGHTTLTSLVAVIVVMAAVTVSFWKPAIIAYVALAEIVVGSKGYLLVLHIHTVDISLRLLLFLASLLVIAIRWKTLTKQQPPRRVWLPPLAFVIWVGWETLWGVLQHYPVSRVFFDMNAFLFVPTVAMWWMLMRADDTWKDRVWLILLAGVTLIGLKSWLMVTLFGLNLSWILHVYQWIRNTGVGEVTFISPGVYRVFFQSQIYGLFVGLLMLGRGRMVSWPTWWWIPWLSACLAVWASLSRSYWWLGIGGAAAAFFVLAFHKRMWRGWGRTFLRVAIGVVVGFFLFNWAVNFPYPYVVHGKKGDAVATRLSNQGAGDASTARKNQIAPLLKSIRSNPVFGRGFGANVRYYSTDPRIRGWRDTDAFELGYLDLWLKLGIVGLALFAWWGWSLLRTAWNSPLSFSVIPSLVALAAVHATSPYLNHPLGLAWLALMTLFLYAETV